MKELSMEVKIQRETDYYGLKYDIDCRIITDKQVEIADKYSETYCRNGKCLYNYACCQKCSCHSEDVGCTDLPVQDRCKVFFCSSVVRRINLEDRAILNLDFLL